MISNFKLNTVNAKSVGESGYINKSGAYKGVIKLARIYDSEKGATMLVLDFDAENSEHATITMALTKRNGEETFNRKIVDALMTVLKVREIAVVQSLYADKDGNSKTGYLLTELMNKPVGLLLQNAPEEYRDNKTGEIRVANRMMILTPFDPQTMQNAREILLQQEGKYVLSKLETLKDRDVKKLTPSDYSAGFERPYQPPVQQAPQYQQAPQSYQQQPPQQAVYNEEDIPF